MSTPLYPESVLVLAEPVSGVHHSLIGYGVNQAGADAMLGDLAALVTGTPVLSYRVLELIPGDRPPNAAGAADRDAILFLKKTIGGKVRKRELPIDNISDIFILPGGSVNLADPALVALQATYYDPVWLQTGWTIYGSTVTD
jgi:hypothetical protein